LYLRVLEMLELSQLVRNFPITEDTASSCSSFLLLPEPKKKKKTEITKLLPQQTVCKLKNKKNRKFSSLRKPSPKALRLMPLA
jgi:hypothetical protein